MSNSMRFLPKVGQHVELTVADWTDQAPYPTWVEDVGLSTVAVAVPIRERMPVRIPAGADVTLRYADERGVYSLKGTVAETQKEPPLLFIQVEEVSRGQNRKYFRWQAQVPVRLIRRAEVPGFAGFDRIPTGVCRRGLTRDISGGGMLLECAVALEQDEIVMAEIDLGGVKIEAEGRVVRVAEGPSLGTPRSFLVGIEFTRICDAHRDKIVGFIFREQMRLRKEGRL